MTRDSIESAPAQRVALPRAAADRRRAADRIPFRVHAAGAAPTGWPRDSGFSELYIKDDSVNHPTLSYKDRVVSMAATRAVELGFSVFGCASTGNLANSVSAHAARLGLECYVFIPHDLELGKVLGSADLQPARHRRRGNYDDVNRLCTQIADKLRVGIRQHQPAQLLRRRGEDVRVRGCRAARLAIPAARRVAGRRRDAAAAHPRGFRELREIGLVEGELPRIHAAQAAGCAPVVRALEEGLEFPEPVKPQTIAKSIAIGNPADGFQVVRDGQVDRRHRAWRRATSEILQAMELLAETEGIFTEPAGGATLAGAMQLVRRGVIPPNESVVVCITGNGYKTAAETIGSRVRAANRNRPRRWRISKRICDRRRTGGGAASRVTVASFQSPASSAAASGAGWSCLKEDECKDRSGFDREDMTWLIEF